jgi:cytochrome c556
MNRMDTASALVASAQLSELKESCMRRTRPHLWKLLLCVICIALPLTSALAQSDEAFITYRQKVMQSIGANIGAIGATLKNKLPYQDNIATHAQEIQLASTLIASAFKKEITAGKTDAKPDIWQDWDKFTTAAKHMGEEAGKLAMVAKSGDMAATAAQLKALGKACGNCHKPFRKPKEESYKRQ